MQYFKFTLLITLLLISLSEQFFKSKFKDLRDKAKDIYRSKFGKDKTWHFLGHDMTEYPGTNEEYRKINRDKWNEYYKCLQSLVDNLGEHGSAIPEAVLGFPGGYVKFECNICVNPLERSSTDSVDWFWAYKTQQKYQPVVYDERIFLSPDDKSLHIYNLQVENTGQYICHMGDSLTVPYFLTVINSTMNMSEVHAPGAPKGPYPLPAQVDNNLELITEWQEWSPCSTCNVAGRKHKLGYCEVNYIGGKIERDVGQSNSSFDNSTEEYQIVEDVEIKNSTEYIKLLQIMRYGIPCRSHILPKSISDINIIRKRKEEVMIGYCKVTCPKPQVFEVKDEYGNVIEKANNSDGIYSMTQGLPQAEPPVERRLMYGSKGNDIIISCPGNLNSDAPIKWHVGRKTLIPEVIRKESNGRIYITLMDRIVIQKAKVSDSNIFSCWQNGELAGTVRLIVERKFNMNFNHHVMLLGLIVIVGVFVFVFVRAFAGRKYARVKEYDE